MQETIDIGIEIITKLKEKGIELDGGMKNFIIIKVAESRGLGVEAGIRLGMDIAFVEFEKKLETVKEQVYLRRKEEG